MKELKITLVHIFDKNSIEKYDRWKFISFLAIFWAIAGLLITEGNYIGATGWFFTGMFLMLTIGYQKLVTEAHKLTEELLKEKLDKYFEQIKN